MAANRDDDPPAELSDDQHRLVDAWLDELLEMDAARRPARLAEHRRHDAAAAAEVASLLAAAASCGDFLSQPAMPGATGEAPTRLQDGVRIGAWRVVREIGYGGMGEVYEAERVEGGFAQRAALKLLR